MSHVVTLQSEFKNDEALKAACAARGVPVQIAEPGQTLTRELFSGKVKGRAAFRLKNWRYDCVVQDDGSCKADNYNGAWGAQEELDALKQEYGAELATAVLGTQRYRVQSKQVVENGALELVFVGG